MIIRIGKASDNDFVVNDPHVSRYHAKLIREEGGCWLLEVLSPKLDRIAGSNMLLNDLGTIDKCSVCRSQIFK